MPALAEGTVVAIDGKASRRSRQAGKQALHMVSAFAAEAGLVLGQEACAEKSNELTAIPVLLDALMLKGVIVTIDAMGTHSTGGSLLFLGETVELTIFVDGTPEDWFLPEGKCRPHTIALICSPLPDALDRLISRYSRDQPSGLKEWKQLGRGSPLRRKRAFKSFLSNWSADESWLNVIVYEEAVVAQSAEFLGQKYGEYGIGFEITVDGRLRHQYVDFTGLHVIEGAAAKILPLLLLGWVIRDMVSYYANKTAVDSPASDAKIKVVLNYLSGDHTDLLAGEKLLRDFLEYDGIHFELSSAKGTPELIMADNIAGIFHRCLTDKEWASQLPAAQPGGPFTWLRYSPSSDLGRAPFEEL